MIEISDAAGGRRLAYWRSTPAAPRTVLLLHGLGADHQGLLPMTLQWPDTRVVAPDLPGFGRSDPLDVAHSVTNYAHAMETLCADLDLSDLFVVGHSFGASVAVALAATYPHRVRALVLISPIAGGTGPHMWLARGYYGVGCLLPLWAARPWFLSRAAVYASDRSMFATTDRRVRRRILEADYRSAALTSPLVITEIYRSIRATPLMMVARNVRTPTLLVGGEHDNLAAPVALAALNNQFPLSELQVIANAGHLWCVEEPEDAGRVILASIENRGWFST